MAGDTQDPLSSQSSNSSPGNSTSTPGKTGSESPPAGKQKRELPKSQVGKLWDAFGNPEDPANVLSGTAYDPARQKPKDASVMESIKSLSMKDVTTFYKAPCARDSLMTGMGVGFAAGGIRAVVGKSPFRDFQQAPGNMHRWRYAANSATIGLP
jgi:cytochrome c oxidase assembly protein subunit 20